MVRRVFNVLAELSLLLCVATVVMWVGSYRYEWRTCYATSGRHLRVLEIALGQIVAFDTDFTATVEDRPARFSVGFDKMNRREYDETMWRAEIFPEEHNFTRWGFTFASGRRHYFFASSMDAFATGGTVPVQAFAVPHWFIAVLLAIAPLVKLRSLLQIARRKREGLYLICGYDLRATPDRCPECGTMPVKNDLNPNSTGNLG